MPIINVRDNENIRWKRKSKKQRSGASYSKSVRAKWFCCALKLGFVQLIRKAILFFQSNLELVSSNILKERELYKLKHVAVECRCLKICYLLSFLICCSILVLKWRQVSPMSLELQLAQVNLYLRKDFKSSGIGSLYEKYLLIFNELKTSLNGAL